MYTMVFYNNPDGETHVKVNKHELFVTTDSWDDTDSIFLNSKMIATVYPHNLSNADSRPREGGVSEFGAGATVVSGGGAAVGLGSFYDAFASNLSQKSGRMDKLGLVLGLDRGAVGHGTDGTGGMAAASAPAGKSKSIYDAFVSEVGKKRKSSEAIIGKFDAEDALLVKQAIEGKIDLLSAADRNLLDAMFKRLDKNGNGILEKNDFQDPHHPHLNNLLKNLWSSFVDHFDFNGDDKVNDFEFKGYFVVFALHDMKNKSIPAGTFSEQYKAWKRAFLDAFALRIKDFQDIFGDL